MTRTALLRLGIGTAQSAAAPSINCVAEGAWISTPEGRTPIEALREGDTVYSVDTDSWALVEVSITRIESTTRECVALELASRERLRCSSTHPVFDPARRRYCPAGEWVTDGPRRVMQIVEGRARTCELAQLSAYAGLATVFDLRVSGRHANFIADGMIVGQATD